MAANFSNSTTMHLDLDLGLASVALLVRSPPKLSKLSVLIEFSF